MREMLRRGFFLAISKVDWADEDGEREGRDALGGPRNDTKESAGFPDHGPKLRLLGHFFELF